MILIQKYMAQWSYKTHKGKITLVTKDPAKNKVQWYFITDIDDAGEFSTMVDLLRNEKPLYYYDPTKTINTFAEEVGEEET